MFVSQLEEFLEKGTVSPRLEASKFVDSLFSALRTKSYLPYEPIKDVPDGGIPIPLDGLMASAGPSDRARKRSLEEDDHEHPPPKGPRLSSEGHFSRYHGQSRGGADLRGGLMNGRGMGRGEGPSMNGHMRGHMGIDVHHSSPMYRPPGGGFNGRGRRGICRDYHNNGFCPRGSLCQYSHGEDAVIPPMPYPNGPIVNPMQGPPFMPMFAPPPFGGMPGAAYDPHESHMEMGPRPPRGQRAPESHGMHDPTPVSSVELPVIQDLTPRDPVEEATRGDGIIQPNGFTHNFGAPRRAPPPAAVVPRGNAPPPFGGGVGGHMNVGGGVGGHMNVGGGVSGHMNVGGVGGGVGGHMGVGGGVGGHMGTGGGFRRPGRGMFTGDNHTFRNGTPRDDKTLVVEKIPEDKLTLEAVNEWFKRFGTVTNVAIDSPSAKALVSFANHSEAHSAWKSEEAVFGNRFVKLYWHRPLEGHGGIGQRALAASAPLVRNIGVPESPSQVQAQPQSQPQPQPPSQPQPQPQPQPQLPPSQSPSQPSAPSIPVKQPQKSDPAAVAALAARQQLLEKQISEQKVLMSRLTTASTPEEKQELMARIKSIQSGVTPSSPASTAPSTSRLSNGSSKEALSEKERLDKELELHTVQNALKGDEDASSTTALKEKLARLKAEASRLGVPESEINAESSTPSHSSPYRPYRGRGYRARGFVRGGGRGGASRPRMKLDNRPRKLLIQGIPVNDQAVQLIRNHYQNMGNLESFWSQGEGEVVAQFWSRTAAEYAFLNAPDIPSVGKVQISWHTGTAPTPTTPVPATTLPVVGSDSLDGKVGGDSDAKMDVEARRGDHEDGGWGQAYDDEEEGRRRRSRSASFS
ncbi:hypothetical protein JB92DRAFT_2860770 [Gautieria morchelliformis]|nr:hypothetical protein JB92DRAFT_2860770 [Gautieria morchelliformis]